MTTAEESRKRARFMEALSIPNPSLSELQDSLVEAERKFEILEDQQTRLNIQLHQNERLIHVHRERVLQLRQDIQEKVEATSSAIRHSDIRNHFTRATAVEIPKTGTGRSASPTPRSDTTDSGTPKRPLIPPSPPPLETNYSMRPFTNTSPAQTPTNDHLPAMEPLEID